jgi:hypothetical protein
MPQKTASTPADTLALLHNCLKATHDVVHHIAATRGPRAAYYRVDRRPWPIEATDILSRDTSRVIEYINDRHALDVGIPLERIRQAAMTWTAKRDSVVAFGKTKHADTDAAATAACELERFIEDGLPEQKRLNLDLRIAEGAVWRAVFPLLAEHFGKERPFLIRRNLIRWSLWVREAFAEVIRQWSLPDEHEIVSRQNENDEPSVGWLESQERWELANMIIPRYIPSTDETPKKLAIEEARRVRDLAIALPLIKKLDDQLEAFVLEAVRWPQGNLQPSRTEHLLQAVTELEDLVGSEASDSASESQPTRALGDVEPPANGVRGEGTSETKTETAPEVSIPNRARKAGEQYRQAAEALGVSDPTDRQAYDQMATAMETSGEREDLASFDTWQRNLREYRRLTGQQKNRPRAGREGSARSLVRADQIEPQHLPTRIRSKRVDE